MGSCDALLAQLPVPVTLFASLLTFQDSAQMSCFQEAFTGSPTYSRALQQLPLMTPCVFHWPCHGCEYTFPACVRDSGCVLQP